MSGAFVQLVTQRPPGEFSGIIDRLRPLGLQVQFSRVDKAIPATGQLPILWILDAGAGRAAIKHWVESSRGPLEARGAFLIALLASPLDSDARAYWTGMGLGMLLDPQSSTEELGRLFQEARTNALSPARRVAQLIQTLTGVQLPPNKDALIRNRLTRRLLEVGVKSLEDYVQYLESHQETELPFLISSLTTHTTEFFRDSDHFDDLTREVLPSVIARGEPIRIWSAACSTGEEIYSLAIAVSEFLERTPGAANHPWEILGTDVDPKSVARAREGVYPANALKRINPLLLKKHFDTGSGELAQLVRAKNNIWKHCRFETFNLLLDKPRERHWSSIFVRNVFIYFKSEDIQRVARSLASTLVPQGRIYLGCSEFLDEKESSLHRIGKGCYSPLPQRGASLRPAEPLSRGSHKPIRVMVVDDSKTIRLVMREILSERHGFEVVAEAEDPIAARDLLKKVEADVMTLDIHMPRMDGITYLSQERPASHPPIIVMSSVNEQEALQVFRCLELGAMDYIEKPKGQSFHAEADSIRATLRAAIFSKKRAQRKASHKGSDQTFTYDGVGSEHQLILIGASTGGIDAIREILPKFPWNSPPVVIAQHIPTSFSAMFARRLNEFCQIRVKEAEDGEILSPGTAYIGPGGKQFLLEREQKQLRVVIKDGLASDLYRPCIDQTFRSVANVLARQRLQISAAILTGMGRDGAMGLKALKDLGAHTVAQDEASSVIYGMPKAAAELNAALDITPLEQVPRALFSHFLRNQRHTQRKAG